MSELYRSLSHSKWDCKYHVVCVPKRRRKIIFGQTRRQLGPIFHSLARQKECQILEGHLMPDHVHMCIAIPPKHPQPVVLRFRADQAPYVRERLWHPSQQLMELPDGGVQLAFRPGGPYEIRRWILGWGDAVEVISPSDLRDGIAQILTAAASLY